METIQELLTLNGKEYLLNIEQAKKLNLLKEKDSRVKSWEEFREKYYNRFGYFQSNDITIKALSPTSDDDQLTQHESKAIAAFSKLLKLRRDWIGEWEPDWGNYNNKYIINHCNSELFCGSCQRISRSLSFPTKKMAQEFLKTFKDLIEEAKILI